jgi:hypothetical protein
MAHLAGTVPASEIIIDAAQSIGDPGCEKVGRPRYKSFVQKALAEMCFDAKYDHRYFDAAIDETRIIKVPKYVAGVNAVYAYNGENCNVSSRVNIYLKRNYFHNGVGNKGFARNNWSNIDDNMQTSSGILNEPTNRYYYGWDETAGEMHLSPTCSRWQRVRIEYVGIGMTEMCQEEQIRVPMWCREAIEHYVAMRAAQHLIHLEGKTRIATDQYRDFKEEYKGINGSWANARARWADMDDKERDDIALYISQLGWPQ